VHSGLNVSGASSQDVVVRAVPWVVGGVVAVVAVGALVDVVDVDGVDVVVDGLTAGAVHAAKRRTAVARRTRYFMCGSDSNQLRE
jgi:hypothetical protein